MAHFSRIDTGSPALNRWQFDSLSDLVEHCERTPIASFTGLELSNGFRHFSRDWYGGATLEEACRFARFGWREGRDKMGTALQHAKAATAPREVPVAMFDVAGEVPDVGRFLSGDPLCMLNERPDATRVKPVIRVIASTAASSSVEGSQIMNRGAAVLAQVDAWEQAGWECEIISESSLLCYSSFVPVSIPRARQAKQLLTFETTIKRAGEPLDIDAAAFALIHPAMLRRLIFRAMEAFDSPRVGSDAYGMPEDLPATFLGDFKPCVYLGKMFGAQPQFATAASATAHVGAMFEKAIEASRDAA